MVCRARVPELSPKRVVGAADLPARGADRGVLVGALRGVDLLEDPGILTVADLHGVPVVARDLEHRASGAHGVVGPKGRAWLAEQPLPADESETVTGCLAQIAFCDQQITAIDRQLAQFAVASAQAKRLMTIPGIGVASAVTLIAAIGDITRFEDPRKLVGYLGLDPKVRQSGDSPTRGARSASAATPRPARCSSRPPGPRCAPPARCARSANASRPAGAVAGALC